MGKIKKILENELTGGTQSTEVYPITSIKAVYDENNERLDNIIDRKDKELEAEVARATNAESNLRETINNITEINENATSANIVTIDTIPNTSSSNVQQALNELFKNATLQEIIYDVSAHNDGAVFESLQALLSSSNLSTLIPTSVRHGGMSIRFVQSADNKYVQYRLMANTFSTTTTDWQGVDDEPTAGSENLIKSGGVYEGVNKLNVKVFGFNYTGDYTYSKSLKIFEMPVNIKAGESFDIEIESETASWNRMYIRKNYTYNNLISNIQYAPFIIRNATTDVDLSVIRFEAVVVTENTGNVSFKVSKKSIEGELNESINELREDTEASLLTKVEADDIILNPSYIKDGNLACEHIIAKTGVKLTTSGKEFVSEKGYISKYLNVELCTYLQSDVNIEWFAYDNNKQLLGRLYYGMDNDSKLYIIYFKQSYPSIKYVRCSGDIGTFNTLGYIYFDRNVVPHSYVTNKKFPIGTNLFERFKNKKMVTLGDSITYQSTWQGPLAQMLGTFWSRQETRGSNEKVLSEGYGYIKLNSDLSDTDEYFTKIDGITLTENTVTDGFGYSHPIYEDGNGNKYRMPYRMAEGGETLMPMRVTSIYSRATDVKWYKPDLLIVFAGANDKITNVKSYPTNKGGVSQINGWTNLKTDSEDGSFADADFEIYTNNSVLTQIGTYGSEVGLASGDTVAKWSATFRACYRGMLKRLVDDNPNTEIVVLGTFSTFLKANAYNNLDYDTYTDVINDVIKEAARDFSCQYIDLNPLFGRYAADRFFRNTDGTVYIHPTIEGGLKIANYIYSQLL